MKKVAVLFIAVLFSVMMFTSCSEKQITPADIEGTWINVVEGPVVTNTFVYTFNTDMTYSKIFSADTEVVSIGSDKTGTYSLSGSSITVTENSESITFKVKFEWEDMIWITEAGRERVFVRQ